MPKTSTKTLRVQGLKPDTTISQLQDAVKPSLKPKRRSIFSSSKGLKSDADTNDQQPLCFLAAQNGFLAGTISFASAEEKERAVGNAENLEPWEFDDRFDGMTTLYAGEQRDIDVCAVHGLGGNAIDTWESKTKLWLRDLLPESAPFEQSRIMTFGYDSTLINRKSNNRIKDWADELLHQLGHLRTDLDDQQKPIIFICHSLGGLVVREAMIRLHRQASQFDGIKLNQCGIIFLGTPHSGTTEADWNQFLLGVSELTLGVRSHAIVDQLASFNPSSVDSEEEFATMPTVPPFHCFCEGEKTMAVGKNRTIVTQASAGFFGHKADMIINVDHHQICKYDSPFASGYMNILAQLKKIRKTLLSLGANEKLAEYPGQPDIVAPHYPLSTNTKWYEGSNLHFASQLVGRSDTLDIIIDSLQKPDQHSQLIALTGIGGIGKTEILLEVAFRFRNKANVFFIKAYDRNSLQSALLEIAGSIGHDLLSAKYPRADLASLWRTYGPQERIQAFKTWLAHEDNQTSLFLVDDLDGFKEESLITDVLPREAKIALYSARDPNILEDLGRESQTYHISNMDTDEMTSLMNRVLQRGDSRISQNIISEEELEAVADIVDGHALGACRAVAYILKVLSQTSDTPAAAFIELSRGTDWRARRGFLDYKSRRGMSIMETFTVSIERIRRHEAATTRLLELLAFLSSRDKGLDFRDFLGIKRRWLGELKDVLPDYEVFARGLIGQNEYLAELERVSIGLRPSIPGPLRIHPLWIECIQQRASHAGRVQWLRQILILCHASFVRDEKDFWPILRPFAINIQEIAFRFAISIDELLETRELLDWARRVYSNSDESQPMLAEENTCHQVQAQNDVDSVQTIEQQRSSTTTSHQEDAQILNPMSILLDKCQSALQDMNVSSIDCMSEEISETAMQRFVRHLRRLQQLEKETSEDVLYGPACHAKHLEVYRVLIDLAPTVQRKNPRIVEQLNRRMEHLVEQVEQHRNRQILQ